MLQNNYLCFDVNIQILKKVVVHRGKIIIKYFVTLGCIGRNVSTAYRKSSIKPPGGLFNFRPQEAGAY